MLSNTNLYNELMKQVAVEGAIWSYEELPGKGVSIVILHGWGRRKEEWMELGQYLHSRTGRTILIPDLPGFGGSGMVTVQDIYEYTALLVKWLRYLGLERVSFVGHSLGGRMAVAMGARYPGLVENLVMIAPAAVKPVTLRRLILRPLRYLVKLLPRFVREAVGLIVSDVDGRDIKRRELYKAVVKYDLRHELPKVKSPTLVIWGERDPILPLKLLGIYKKLLPDVRTRVVWEAGHDPHLTHFRELSRMVEEIWI